MQMSGLVQVAAQIKGKKEIAMGLVYMGQLWTPGSSGGFRTAVSLTQIFK